MDRAAKISDLRKRLELLENRQRTSARSPQNPGPNLETLEESLGGQIRETPHGRCLTVERSFSLSHRHGDYPLAEAFKYTAGEVLARGGDPRLRGFNPDRALFVDTETTGLAMGAGTYAFLVGVGIRKGDRFLVRQFFMRDFSEEGAKLHLLGELLKEGDFLVSFNGKSYDIPLLENRFIISRMSTELSDMPHLDLLYTARRLWKHRLEDCRLGTLERELLGVRREEDIPSHAIPQVFFDYLRGRGREEMKLVFHHNLLDILSLTVLGGVISGAVADPHVWGVEEGGDLLALGRLWEEAGAAEEGRFCYEKALEMDMASGQRSDAMARLSLIYKREGRWEEAVALWERMLADSPGDLFPSEELAKYYEHRVGDFLKALQLVEEALVKVYFPHGQQGRNPNHIISSLKHRRDRLRIRSGMGASHEREVRGGNKRG